MLLRFSKFHGTGNDFIIIDNRKGNIRLSADEIMLLCNRRFGVGADGLIMLERTVSGGYRMRYYNSDGHEATMCGNGGRCLAAWAVMKGIATDTMTFMAADGSHSAIVKTCSPGSYDVVLTLNDVTDFQKFDDGYFVNTGSPHFVRFVEDVDNIDVVVNGRQMRHDERFQPGGVNVNFVALGEEHIRVRTYERGVEAETLSCGTGVTASAIASMLALGSHKNKWNIQTLGGQLAVEAGFTGKIFSNVILSGPAQLVFKGQTNLLS